MKFKYLSVMFFFLPFLTNATVLPDLPVGFKSGVGVINDNVIYIGLGTAGKSWYKIDMNDPEKKWQKIAEFPGVERSQAVAATIKGNIYVFGGLGKNEKGLTSSLDDSYVYNPKTNIWMPIKSHSPQSFIGSSIFTHDGKVFVTGGVNQNIFNGYFEDINAYSDKPEDIKQINYKYFNKTVADLFFSDKALSFDPESLQWSYAGTLPYGTAGATVIEKNNNLFIINGEVKPGLRTNVAYTVKIGDIITGWQKMPNVASPDGVAGAFGGVSQGQIIFTGGAGFKGSRSQYDHGKLYAHEGLKKFYSNKIDIFKSGKWITAAELPYGIAYGVSVPWNDGLLMIGGEMDEGKASDKSLYLKINQERIDVVQ